jgi:hypothetical protein
LPNIGLLQNTQSNIFIFTVYKRVNFICCKKTSIDGNGCRSFHKWQQMMDFQMMDFQMIANFCNSLQMVTSGYKSIFPSGLVQLQKIYTLHLIYTAHQIFFDCVLYFTTTMAQHAMGGSAVPLSIPVYKARF